MTLDGIDKPTNKRPNYFAGQYLLEDDFQLEQQYHIDRQRRHNRLLHVSGIAEGLIVTKVSDLTVKITKGTAIDNQGRQIVQLEDIEALNLFKIAGDGIKQGEQIKDGDYILSVGYSCELSKEDKQGEDDIRSTRLVESPQFKLSSPTELKDFIPLAKITINNNVVASDKIDNRVRVYSGLRLPTIDGEISLSYKNDGSKSLAELKGSLNITGTLFVTGNVGIGTTNPASKLTVVGTATISDENHNHFATKNGFMASGSLTVGSTEKNYGGETKPWKEGTEYNAAGLLLEAKANTEIAVHDAATRLASLMYYEGDATNRITIGRDMGWGAIKTVSINGNVGIGTATSGAKLQIVDSFQNANGGTLILGSIDASNLRLGYDKEYTWIQSHLSKPLAINPLGNNVGIGTTNPIEKLEISGGNLKVSGNIFASNATLTGNTKSEPIHPLRINPNGPGGIEIGNPNVFSTEKYTRLLLIISAEKGGYGEIQASQGSASANLILQKGGPEGGNVGIGTTQPGDKLSIQGGALSFHNPSNPVPYVGLDYNSTTDALRIRGNIGATVLNTDYVTIDRKTGNVGIGTTDLGPYRLKVQGDQCISGNQVVVGNSLVEGAVQGTAGDSQGAVLQEMFGPIKIAFDYVGGNRGVTIYTNTGQGGQWQLTKTFVINHPQNQSKYLIHGTLEGPEAAVYYRGTGQLVNGKTEITLPDYFEALTRQEGRTIILTNLNGFDRLMIQKIERDKIRNGKFIVVSDNPDSCQEFDWEVKAVRQDVLPLVVEPDKKDLEVKGYGPYTYAIPKTQ